MSNKNIIIHSLPYNPEICGGIKVHYQLAMLEQQLGYDVFMIYDNANIPEVNWFPHTCKEMTLSVFKDYLIASRKNVLLVIGYEDPASLNVVRSQYKVAYIQGHVYYQKDKYKDAFLWFNSNYCKEACEVEGELLPPYLSSSFSINDPKFEWINRKDKYTLLIQDRKQGTKAWEDVKQYLSKEVFDRLDVVIHKNSSEKEFIGALKKADIFFAHSYPEGFNLPPLEAMCLGPVVIGYTGGGGSDFMQDKHNCLIADDGNAKSVAENIEIFVNDLTQREVFDIKRNALCTAKHYNPYTVIKILKKLLNLSKIPIISVTKEILYGNN